MGDVIEHDIQIPVRQVRRKQVKAFIIGASNRFVDTFAPFEELSAVVPGFGSNPKIKCGRPLGIEIAQQGRGMLGGRQIGEIDTRSGFTNTAFDTV
jgi:hypothetical protein